MLPFSSLSIRIVTRNAQCAGQFVDLSPFAKWLCLLANFINTSMDNVFEIRPNHWTAIRIWNMGTTLPVTSRFALHEYPDRVKLAIVFHFVMNFQGCQVSNHDVGTSVFTCSPGGDMFRLIFTRLLRNVFR